jgi:hypothetical protein
MAKRVNRPVSKVKVAKVKLPIAAVKAAGTNQQVATVKSATIASKTSAWQMDSFSVHCIASNYPPLSPKGIQLSVAFMEYEKECSQAKIELIDKIKIIISPPVIVTSKLSSKERF